MKHSNLVRFLALLSIVLILGLIGFYLYLTVDDREITPIEVSVPASGPSETTNALLAKLDEAVKLSQSKAENIEIPQHLKIATTHLTNENTSITVNGEEVKIEDYFESSNSENIEELLWTILEAETYEQSLTQAEKLEGIINELWAPIESISPILDQLDNLETIYVPYDFLAQEPVIDLSSLRRIANFHSYKAFLLAAQGKPNEAMSLISRMLRISQSTYRESDSIMSILTNISVQAILIHHSKPIIENEMIDPVMIQSLLEASIADMDTIDLFERAIATEQKINYEQIVQMKDHVSEILNWRRILPNATISSSNSYYIKSLDLLRKGKIREFEALTQEQEDRFTIRNNLGNSIYSVLVLNLQTFQETAQKHEAKLKEFQQTCQASLSSE